MHKCLFVCSIVVISALATEAFFIKNKKDVEVVSYAPHIVYGPPEKPKEEEQPLFTKEDYKAIIEALKEKAKENNPIEWIKKKFAKKNKKEPVYQLHPELGFSHYNKIQYVPLVPIYIEPEPVVPVETKPYAPVDEKPFAPIVEKPYAPIVEKPYA